MSSSMKGWKDTLTSVKNEIKHDRISMVSAAMAYYILFALVPALTSVVLIYAWVSNPNEIAGHIAKAKEVLPAEMMDTINTQLQALAGNASSRLGFGAIFTVLLSLFAASKGSKAAIEAMNIIHGEEEKRGFFRLNALGMAMTFLGAILAILAMGVIVGIPAVTSFLKIGADLQIIATVGSWFILLGIFSFYLSTLYYFGPNREKRKWKWISVGAVVAAVLWAIVSALFSWYAKEFGNFNKTYGSLGAVIVVMTWFYLSSFVVLLGGEINAVLEERSSNVVDKVKSFEARTSAARDHHLSLSGLKKFFSRGHQHRV